MRLQSYINLPSLSLCYSRSSEVDRICNISDESFPLVISLHSKTLPEECNLTHRHLVQFGSPRSHYLDYGDQNKMLKLNKAMTII